MTSADHLLGKLCCGDLLVTSQADVDQRLRWSLGGAGLTRLLTRALLPLARRAVARPPNAVRRA